MWKKLVALSLTIMTAALLAGCGGQDQGKKTRLNIFAAASMTETMDQIKTKYEQAHPDVTIVCNYDSSGTLKKQIQNGAACDIFISAAQKQMNQLDAAKDKKANPDGLDFVKSDSRVNLLENKVILVVPEGNPKNVTSFADMAAKLKSGDIRLVMGNSDVPVGQYTAKILEYFQVPEQETTAAGHITYGSNVKEVTTQVVQGSADCGVVYATDAYSAKLKPIDEATKDMCGQVIYPAAVMKDTAQEKEAKAFLDYLKGDEAMAIFQSVGFSPVK